MWLPGYVDCTEGADAEFCPDPLPADAAWWMVYAGGSSAGHAWDAQELARVAHLPRLPVWVPTPGSEDPVRVADEFLTWLHDHSVPLLDPATGERLRVMWDMERGKTPDPVWLNKAADHLHAAGVRSLVYGSVDTLFRQPPRAGYCVANPTGSVHMYPRPEVVLTQWIFDVVTPGGTIDRSAATTQLVRQMWQPAG